MPEKKIIQSLPLVIYSAKVDFKNLKLIKLYFLNNYITQLTGWTIDDIKSDPYWWIKNVHPEDREKAKALQNLKKDQIFLLKYRFKKKDGSYLWLKSRIKILDIKDGIADILVFWEDKTEESSLVETILENSPVGIAIYSDKMEFANDEFLRLLGYTLDELKNKHPWDLVAPEIREKIKKIVLKRLEGNVFGKHYNELPVITKSGERRIFRMYANTIFLEGKPKVLGIVLDVTNEKKAKEKLELDSCILNNIADAVIIRDFDTQKIIYVNNTASKILGYSKEELMHSDVKDIVTEESLRKKEEVLKNLKEKGFYSFESEMVRKDGSVFPAEVDVQLIQINNKKYIVSILRDITERNKYLEKIHYLSRLYKTISEINEILVYSKTEEEVFENICKVVVEHSGFKLAWIGIVDEKNKKVVPVSYHMADKKYIDYIKSINISLNPEDETSKGPTGQAVLQDKIIINPDVRTNPSMKPWREKQLEMGFISSLAIPFEKEGKVYGVLNLYSCKTGIFDEEFLNLFLEIKKDLSFAITKIEQDKWENILNVAINEGVDWVLITDDKGKIVYVNKVVERISGYKKEEIIGKTPKMFESGIQDDKFLKKVWEHIKKGKTFQGIFINRRKNGKLFYLNTAVIPIFKDGKLVNIVETGKDITQEKILENELKKISFYDTLTELPNRNLFVEELSNYIERAVHEKHQAAVLIIDLNKFSYINNTYGYQVGDTYLKKFAQKLKTIFRKGDVVARIGNDEFAILLEDLADKKDIIIVLEKMKEELEKPIVIDNNEFVISYNIGISIFPDDGKDAETLLRQADIALTSAKLEGENEYKFFENQMNQKASQFIVLKKQMIEALQNEEFTIYYQPYFDTVSKELKGFEALLRWKVGDDIISPGVFIPILEETGLIRDVEKWILNKVCLQLNEWKEKGYKVVPISVNISPVSFKKGDLKINLTNITKNHNIDPEFITIEITESSFIDNFEFALGLLNEMKIEGFKISIDDFGTGYSSLSYLRNIPADILKIDISFIRDIFYDQYDLAVVETIINISKKFEMKTIAEGVETIEQLELLRKLGCDMLQGYLLSKPIPVEEAEKFLK